MRDKGRLTQYIHKSLIKKIEAKQEQIKHNITGEARGHQNKTGRGTSVINPVFSPGFPRAPTPAHLYIALGVCKDKIRLKYCVVIFLESIWI